MRRLLLDVSCLLALAALFVAHAQAETGEKPVKRAPTELWNAFPLQEKKPTLVESGVLGTSVTRAQPPLSDALPEPNALMSEPLSRTVVTAAMLLMLAVAAVALVIFNPVASRAGRTPDAIVGRRSFGAPLRRARLQLLPDVGRRRPQLGSDPPPPRAPAPAPPPAQQLAVESPPIEPDRRYVGEAAERPTVDDGPTETCRIQWQRLYVSSEFVASNGSTKRPVAVSRSFRWWRGLPPPVNAATDAALAALVVTLRKQGWAPSGAGKEWYELEFTRPANERPPVSGPYCTIEWERFYVTARFDAYLVDPGGGRKLVAASPEFRWLHTRPPEETTRARQALDMLIEKLRRSGYEPSGRGHEWFALRLTRPSEPEPAAPPGRIRPAPSPEG
jgi:hypothetical protein